MFTVLTGDQTEGLCDMDWTQILILVIAIETTILLFLALVGYRRHV